MTKRSLLILLAAVNLLLLTCLLLFSYTPPQAYAQRVSLRDEFILVAAQAEKNNDAIYLLDLARRQMHVFRAPLPMAAGQTLMVRWLQTRDLVRDFR